jgi:hypothetical protein
MSAVDTVTARLVERAATAHRLTRTLSTRPAAYCPVHPECVLEGGPIRYGCTYGHSVPAADIDREVSAPASPGLPERQGDHAGRDRHRAGCVR